eukprot:2016896-Alexandrium_andersonii.AAC.1
MLAGCAAGTSFPQSCLASVGALGAGGTKGGTSCLLACLPVCLPACLLVWLMVWDSRSGAKGVAHKRMLM